MSKAHLTLCLLGLASCMAARVPQKALLATHRPPDDDHFVDEIHDNAKLPSGKKYVKPKNSMEQDFVQLDRNGDKYLTLSELMFRQYSSGCEPMYSEIRANDYMMCGDLNKDDLISFEEFKASAQPAWAECIKETKDRRSHGFVKFFYADQNMDDLLSVPELTVGLIKLWGPPGEQLAEPLMKCSDKNKDGFMDQDEFHKSIFAYNPAASKWVMWTGTSDPSILTCMEAAMKAFDASLVFYATDVNKDNRLSQQELYDTVYAITPATIDHTTVVAIIKAADKNKDGWLNVEEFAGAGEAYKGPDEANFFHMGSNATKFPIDTYDEGYGMSVSCRKNKNEEFRVYSDDLGAVRVTPTDDKGGVKVTGSKVTGR